MVRYLFYTIGDLTYQSPLVNLFNSVEFKTKEYKVNRTSCNPKKGIKMQIF